MTHNIVCCVYGVSMRKNMKHGLWSGKKHARSRHKEDRIDFEEFREDFYEDDYEDDYRDDYDERDYAEDDDYYSEDYDDVDRDYEYEDERRGGRRSDDRYEDDVDYRDDERYEDDEDYRDDEQYEEDDNYRDDEHYEDEESYSEDDIEYRDEDERYAEDDEEYSGDDRYEDDERYEDDDYTGDDYSDDYRDDYADDERYEDDEDYSGNERYEDDEDYSEDNRYEDDEEYRDDYDERYDDEYYEDDYEYDRYEDEDRYAPVSAREKERAGRGSGSSKRGKKKKDKAVKSKAGKRKSKDSKDNVFAGIIKFIANTSAVERTAAIVGLVLLAGAVTTGVFFAGVMGKNRTISSFAEVGSNMGEVEVVGQSGLLAIADAEKAKSMTAEIVVESEEEELVQDDAEGVVINMNLTTIKSDMKIKFVNSKTNKLVASVPFKVSVVTPDGSSITYEDDDKDGIIYKKDLKAGKYKVTPNALPSEYSKYNVDTSTKTLTVKDTVEMKPVDVSNEVKKESQVNAAKEDTAVKTQVESQLKDTVEWVESTKKSANGGDEYEEIENSEIDTSKFSFVPGTFMKTAFFTGNVVDPSNSSSTETGANDASTEATTAPKPGKTQEELDAEEAARKEAEKKAQEEAEKKAQEEAAKKAQEEADRKAQEEAAKKAQEEANKKAQEEAAKKAQEEADKKAKEEAAKKNKERILVNGSEGAFVINELKSGESQKVTVTDGENQPIPTKDIKVEISDSQVVSFIDGNTVKAGNKEDKAFITLKYGSYKACTITVYVKKPAANKELKVDPKVNLVYVNQTVPYPLVTDQDGKAVKYTLTSSNTGALQIVDNKSMKGIAEGNATVTVKADGYKEKSFQMPVKKCDLELNTGESTSMKVKEKLSVVQAKDRFTHAVISDITMTSADNNIVKVDGKGLLAVSAGTTKITIKHKNYADTVLTVTVTGGGELPFKYKSLTIIEGKRYYISKDVDGIDENIKLTLTSANTKVATVDGRYINGKAKGETKIKVSAEGYKDAELTVKVIPNSTEPLKDKKGRQLYFKDKDGKYKAATVADYDPNRKFYIKNEDFVYTGWQTIDGKTYFYTKDHEYVTGEQVIQGVKYSFNSDGVLQSNNGGRGIDVSKWNGSIDWKAVKNEGIEFAIIRCGYRGSSAGALIEDPTFRTNIKGAQAAGIKVGIYFFTQAVNEVEAVEEASMAINLAKGYGLSFPIYLDVEGSNGRGDSISAAQRTANIKAFCGTVQNAGYKAGVYANKTWFNEKINTGSLTNYKIWLAQYAASPTYSATRYDMWQYTSKGRVSGISGNVDLNICYR